MRKSDFSNPITQLWELVFLQLRLLKKADCNKVTLVHVKAALLMYSEHKVHCYKSCWQLWLLSSMLAFKFNGHVEESCLVSTKSCYISRWTAHHNHIKLNLLSSECRECLAFSLAWILLQVPHFQVLSYHLSCSTCPCSDRLSLGVKNHTRSFQYRTAFNSRGSTWGLRQNDKAHCITTLCQHNIKWSHVLTFCFINALL